MKTVILSAGHYPAKSGASWEGLREHDVAVEWVNEIADYLTLEGVNVVQIAPSGLTEKVQHVNQWANIHECVAIELHFNAAGSVTYVQGNETLYYPGSDAGKVMAESYNEKFFELAEEYVVKDRGVKEGWYRMDRPGVIDFYGDEDGNEMPDYWLRKTSCPALILEPCFMCQIEEIGDDWVMVARAIGDAIKTII